MCLTYNEAIKLYEPRHEISNNVVCAISNVSDQPAHRAFASCLNILLMEQHLEFLILKGSCTGSSESTLFKIPQSWKLHVTAHIYYQYCLSNILERSDIFPKFVTFMKFDGWFQPYS